MSGPTPTAGWDDPDQVAWYVDRLDRLGPRLAGEAMVRDVLPDEPRRVLDLGCGDGRLAALVLASRPTVTAVTAVDRSPAMLAAGRGALRGRRAGSTSGSGTSSTRSARSAASTSWSPASPSTTSRTTASARLFAEIAEQLEPGGLFCNLEVVESATPRLHAAFLAAIGRTADDPEDRLVGIDALAGWMRAAGLEEVDCLWRWRGFALLVGSKPDRSVPGRTDRAWPGPGHSVGPDATRPGRLSRSRAGAGAGAGRGRGARSAARATPVAKRRINERRRSSRAERRCRGTARRTSRPR